MTPWGWGVGPRSPTYSEADLPQGQVPGYPPTADVPGSHSSLGQQFITKPDYRMSLLVDYMFRSSHGTYWDPIMCHSKTSFHGMRIYTLDLIDLMMVI
jgi:hypothetical protein